MKFATLTLTLALLFPALSRADGLAWKGSCENNAVSVKVEPFDDDGQVIVREGSRTIYKEVVFVSTFDPNANEIEFSDRKAMVLKVNRSETLPEASGTLRLHGKKYSLRCNVILTQE